MIERGQRPRFAFEARKPIGIGPKSGGQHLQRDITAQLEVVSAIHLAHTADAK